MKNIPKMEVAGRKFAEKLEQEARKKREKALKRSRRGKHGAQSRGAEFAKPVPKFNESNGKKDDTPQPCGWIAENAVQGIQLCNSTHLLLPNELVGQVWPGGTIVLSIYREFGLVATPFCILHPAFCIPTPTPTPTRARAILHACMHALRIGSLHSKPMHCPISFENCKRNNSIAHIPLALVSCRCTWELLSLSCQCFRFLV